MVYDMNYWMKVGKKVLIVVFTILGLWLAYKLACFYMPFLIAFIISLLVEPMIKFIMKKTKLNRNWSTAITLLIVLSLIVYVLFLGITNLVQEGINLIRNMSVYIEKLQNFGLNIVDKFNSLNIPTEVIEGLGASYSTLIGKVSVWITEILTKTVSIVTSIPLMFIYIIITILATVFICRDKVYILDQIEHHVPTKWMTNFRIHFKEIVGSLKDLLKAQAILISITFLELLIGFYLLNIFGFNIEFPLIAAIVTGIVDALPILGAGTVLIPWAIFSAITGDIKLAIALFVLYLVILIVRQIIEPKIVSKQIGVHPIFTLIAMYTGLKLMGFIGIIMGPVALIILSNVFSEFLEHRNF